MKADLCNISVDWVDPERRFIAHRALARIKGLRLQPDEILLDPPVIIARHVPIHKGEKVKNFLQRNGIAVTLEPEGPHPCGSTPPQPVQRRGSEEILAHQICAQLSTKVPGFVTGTIREGLTSPWCSVWKAGLGLFLGTFFGWVLAFLLCAYFSSHGAVNPDARFQTTVYVSLVAVHGLCGTALGWWLGLKKNLKGAVIGNDAVLELVDATVGNICRFLEENGLTSEGRKHFLSSLQGRINEERTRIRAAVQGSLRRMPLMGGISSRIALKILDASCRLPEMILLNMDMTPTEGRGQRTMLVEGFYSRLDQVFGAAVDSAFSRPISLLLAVMGILAALPFAAIVAGATVW